jgi:hypothetical protein
VLKYSTKTNFGALLLTTPTIERRGYSSESPIKNWYKANVGRILSPEFRYADDISEHGLFVITEIHSTKKCSLISWTSPSKEVIVGVDVGSAGVANVGAHGRWMASSSEGGWNHYQGTVSVHSTPIISATNIELRGNPAWWFSSVCCGSRRKRYSAT